MKDTIKDKNRRQFLKLGIIVAAVGLSPFPAHAVLRGTANRERSLAFYNTHTGESIKTVYWAEGGYIPEALADINHVLRDHRNNEIKNMSPVLLDLLYDINSVIEARHPFHIISGYRSPATNAMLAARSGGVAKHSMHLDGKATDIRVPGRDLIKVRRAAFMLRGGGVGYYPGSDFVHVDVGRVRQWRG
ncbi:MAG: YcbK family protein [Candidatus Nitrotoga sp.]